MMPSLLPFRILPVSSTYEARLQTSSTFRNLLGLPESDGVEGRKIVVLMPDAAGGSNIGIIVDDVHSVIQVRDEDIERINEGITSSISGYVKGSSK